LEAGAIPRQRLDETQTSRRAATAQRDLAKANVAQAEAALRRARETSAIHPDVTDRRRIVERNYDAGSLVGPGDNRSSPCGFAIAETRSRCLELEAGRLRPACRRESPYRHDR
jgi:multidrug efflux pump subunit AcrA (membrane-fusion protein)